MTLIGTGGGMAGVFHRRWHTFAPVHFISAAFWLFLPTVLACHVALSGRVRAQNWVLWVASCVFYGWWDARFLLLIAGSTAVDYMVGLQLGKTDDAAQGPNWHPAQHEISPRHKHELKVGEAAWALWSATR